MKHIHLTMLRVLLVILGICSFGFLGSYGWVFIFFLILLLWNVLPFCIKNEENVLYRAQSAKRYILTAVMQDPGPWAIGRGLLYLFPWANLYTTDKGIIYGTAEQDFFGYDQIKEVWVPGNQRIVHILLSNGRESVAHFSSVAQKNVFFAVLEQKGVQIARPI